MNQLDEVLLLKTALEILKNKTEDEVRFLLPIEENVSLGILNNKVTFLENEFIDMLANTFHAQLNRINMAEGKTVDAGVIKEQCVSAYGYFNEVVFIADKISKDKLRYGDVAIYYTTPDYENLIHAVFESRNIPVVFTGEQHATSSDTIQLALGFIDWWLKKKDEKTLFDTMDNRVFRR